MATPIGWLLGLLGITEITDDGGDPFPPRSKLNFIGADIEDNPDEDRLDVSFPLGVVTSINGVSVPAPTGGGLTVGNSLYASAGYALSYSALDLAGGAGWVTGVLPASNGGTGLSSLGSGIATFLGTPSSSNLAAAVSDETGTGSLVFGTSPTFKTSIILRNPGDTFGYIIQGAAIAANRTVTMPLLAGDDTLVTEAFAATLTNKTIAGANNTLSVRIANDVTGLGSGVATFLATPSSANLAGCLTDETGTGSAVFGTAPLFKTSFNLNNPSDTFKYVFAGAAIAADRTITLPLLLGADTLVTEAFAATLTNKTINGANNTLTARIGSDVSGLGSGIATFLGTPSSANLAAALTDETGTGAAVFGTSPTFKTTFKLNNPADTFAYTFTSAAIAAARNITLPLLAADDTLVTAAFAQTLTNKTIDAPTITGTVTYQGTRLRILSIPGEVQTTDATVTTVASFAMNDETLAAFDVIVTAARGTNVTKGGRWKRSVVYRRTSAGAPTIVGAIETGTDEETDAAWDVTIDVSSNTVRVRVTGAGSTNVNWTCELRVQETLAT